MLYQTRAQLADHITKKLSQAMPRGSTVTTKQARQAFESQKPNAYFEKTLKANLKAMNYGSEACAYCQSNEGSDVDHFEPISINPSKALDWSNYFWACAVCNSNYKRTNYPMHGAHRLLIKPDIEPVVDLLNLTPGGMFFEYGCDPKNVRTPLKKLKNDTTIDVFKLNKRQVLVIERKNAWRLLQSNHLPKYDQARQSHNTTERAQLEHDMKQSPLFQVLCYMYHIYENSQFADALLTLPVTHVFNTYNEIGGWCKAWPLSVRRLFNNLNACIGSQVAHIQYASADMLNLEFNTGSGTIGFELTHPVLLTTQSEAANAAAFQNKELNHFTLQQGIFEFHFHGLRLQLQNWQNVALM